MGAIDTANLSCQLCGCTDERACPGGCSWVSVDPPLCSACVSLGDEDGGEDGDAGQSLGRPASLSRPFRAEQVGDDVCPANAMGMHQPLFLDDTCGYCVNCRTRFAA